ncbi:hypothetical protein DPMN_114955 [Dreissena polymorpha]|uniref:Uncharacterized protein n=1 Tax=Dreissena polymorpha TaxID=45954 RepID=A0A9D4KKC3_DREPO|nr:hypothetical protein DPMN_114955 [Dreissena polymorpha]
MKCLKNIQQSQSALINRIEAIENYNYDCGEYFDQEEMDDNDEVGPSRLESEENGEKSSKFASLAKKFKPTEVCGTDMTNIWRITLLICSEKECMKNYEKTVEDENFTRPGNCDGLMVAKMN